MERDHAPLLDDQPSPDDHLDFWPYRKTLSDIILDPRTLTPLTIGIFGTWGTGKTTLLNMVMQDVKDQHLGVWFNAWKYDKEESLWRALLLRVVAALREALPQEDDDAQVELQELENTLYQAIERDEMGKIEFDWTKLAKGVVETGTKIALTAVTGLNIGAKVIDAIGKSAGEEGPGLLLQAFQRECTKIRLAQVESLEQFEMRFEEIIQRHISPRRLVVFVDDLDRCLPQKAIEVLEAIKLFLDVPGCMFVLGIDRDVIARGIRVKYRDLAGEIEGGQYLEKIIQLPFELPPLEAQDVQAYVQALTPSLPDARCEEIFASGLTEPNPRQIKRAINTFLFLSRLADARVDRLGKLNNTRLAKIVVIQHSYPELHYLLRREPRLLAELETYYRALGARGEGRTQGKLANLPDRLQPFANSEALNRLLLLYADHDDDCFAGLKPLDIRPYYTLVRGVTTLQSRFSSRAIPEPQTITIPAGDFLMGTSQKEITWLVSNTEWIHEWLEKGYLDAEQPQQTVFLADYKIGRYPVTNLEYQAFVDATGYLPPLHWNGPSAPEHLADHPVIYVNFDDAMDYCAWLNQETGHDYDYRLPTEAEWEKAARGTDGRLYPWGNTFVPAHCNTSEGGLNKTTPVGQYSPGGDSPFDCVDMSGNIWEWCLDWFDPSYYLQAPRENPTGPKNGYARVVRGGSWDDPQFITRCAFRGKSNPIPRSNLIGFRVVLASPVVKAEG